MLTRKICQRTTLNPSHQSARNCASTQKSLKRTWRSSELTLTSQMRRRKREQRLATASGVSTNKQSMTGVKVIGVSTLTLGGADILSANRRQPGKELMFWVGWSQSVFSVKLLTMVALPMPLLLLLVLLLVGVSSQNPPYPLQVFYLSPSAVGLLQAPQPIYSARTPDSVFGVEEEEDEEAEASQFHSQDGAGRAVFGYTSPDQARIEARNSDGTVRGSYSYLDPRGETVKVQYWDDGTGFHAAGNHLPGFAYVPQPVRDTPEVEEARKIHLHLYEQALNAALASGEGDNVQSDKESVTEGSNLGEEESEIEMTVYPEHSIGMLPQSLNDRFNAQDDDDAVVIDSPEAQEDISGNYLRNAKTLIKDPNVLPGTANLKEKSSLSPNSGFSYSFRYPVPLYVQVRTVQDDKETTSKETNLNKELSLSQKATLFGAVPVSAVHDAQVSPSQRNSIKNHQILPLYVEPVIDAN